MFVHGVLWLLVAVLVVLGIIGTIVPALPGTILVFAGLFLAAWIDHFNRVGMPLLLVLGAISITSYIIDVVTVGVAARTVKASREAMSGAALGALAGLGMGFVGLLFMPFIGAMIGEWIARRDVLRAGRVGLATGLAMVAAVAARLALAFTMVGIFIVGFLWRH